MRVPCRTVILLTLALTSGAAFAQSFEWARVIREANIRPD